MSADINSKFSINALVSSYGISETKLTKGFKFLFKQPIYRYHLLKCMEFARKELESGTPVKKVALKLGYSSSGSFARAFRKVFPHPPNYYQCNT